MTLEGKSLGAQVPFYSNFHCKFMQDNINFSSMVIIQKIFKK